MARKNLLESVLGKEPDQSPSAKRSDYALKGASGKMKASLDQGNRVKILVTCR